MGRGAGRLERTIEAVGADDNAATREELYGALLAGELSIPLPEPLPEGEWLAEDLDTLEVVLVGSADEPVLPVFTSEEQLLEWRPEGGGYATLESRVVFQMAAENGFAAVAVNPGSPHHGYLLPAEIEVLARGRLPGDGGESMPEGTRLSVYVPADPLSEDVRAVVCEAVAAEPKATGAFAFAFRQEGGPQEHAIAVAFAPGTAESAVDEALRAIVQRAGDASASARELLFVRAGDDLQEVARQEPGAVVFER
jgi:hypothetical protein